METLTDPTALMHRLVDVARQTDKITAIDQADDGAWALQFSDKTVVLMEWATSPNRIVLSAALGAPPSERAEKLCGVALSFSTLWRDSYDVRLGLAGEGGELLLIRDLHSDAGGWDLLPVLEHFAHVAGWWRNVISQPLLEQRGESGDYAKLISLAGNLPITPA
jgi:hypothetical protein